MKKTFLKAVGGGICIAIGATVNLLAGNLTGKILFGFGLSAIIMCGYRLYTGVIGYANTVDKVLKSLWIFVGNSVGCFIVSALVPYSKIHIAAETYIAERLVANSLWQFFASAILCGALMFLSVDSAKKLGSPWIAIFGVTCFLICGFDHSVANMAYVCFGGVWTQQALVWIATCILGNAIGAQMMRILQKGGGIYELPQHPSR